MMEPSMMVNIENFHDRNDIRTMEVRSTQIDQWLRVSNLRPGILEDRGAHTKILIVYQI